MSQELSPIALIAFASKKVGKKYRRSIEVARFYIEVNYTLKTRPIFESRVTKDTLLNALEKMNTIFTNHENNVIKLYNEADLRRVIVFTGVRQFIVNPDWIDIVKAMSDLEVLFWSTKFSYLYERIGYWGMYRVAKAIAILYRL
jgi:hypothetical protein